MKYLSILFLSLGLLFASACSDDDAETPKSGADVAEEDAADESDSAEHPDEDPTTPGTGNNIHNNSAGDACEDRADCSAAAECVDGSCKHHMTCAMDTHYAPDNRCEVEWEGCEAKDYKLLCETDFSSGVTNCTCIINEIEKGEFSISESDKPLTCPERLPTIHHIANEHCGWLVPKISF